MAITDCRKEYNNIYALSGCADGDTLEQMKDKVVAWLEENFSDIITVEARALVYSTINYYQIVCRFIGSAAGAYFCIHTDTSKNSNYAYNSLGYVVRNNGNDTQSLGSADYSSFINGNSNLRVVRSERGLFFGFYPIAYPRYSSVLAKSGDKKVFIQLNGVQANIVVGDNLLLSNENFSNRLSSVTQKILTRAVLPNTDCVCEGLYISDGIMVNNLSVYALNGRYFVDIINFSPTYAGLALEIE